MSIKKSQKKKKISTIPSINSISIYTNEYKELDMNDIFNIDKWNDELVIAQTTNNIKICRIIFNCFLYIFSSSSRYWKIYIERELFLKHYNQVEMLFKACLSSCNDIELWLLYMNYIKDKHIQYMDYEHKHIKKIYNIIIILLMPLNMS